MLKVINQLVLATVASITMSMSANAGLIINEIFQNPSSVTDSKGEWFELYNTGAADIDINGWIIKDNDSDNHTIDNNGSLIIQAGGFLVLGRNGDFSSNGGVNVDYQYSSFILANGNDELALFDSLFNEVDRVEWDNGTTFPDAAGISMALTSASSDNSAGANWSASTTGLINGDFATPGSCNTGVGQQCVVDVPEPTTLAILSLSLFGLAFSRKK